MIAQWTPSAGIPSFIGTLYRNILSREPESQEAIEHHLKAAYNCGLIFTVVGFFDSPEFRGKEYSLSETVARLYRSTLSREPDNSEVRLCVDALGDGGSIYKAVVPVMQSNEYKTRVRCGIAPSLRPHRIPDFVKKLYVTILDRDPESVEVIESHSDFAHTHGLATAINRFIESPEYRGRHISTDETVRKLYRAILGREPNVLEIEHQVGEMFRGGTLQTVVERIVESDEYRRRIDRGFSPSSAAVPISDARRVALGFTG